MIPRVVLFTRYPVAGKAKTRLIPALGEAGAAALHRRLTERTLRAIRDAGLTVEIRSTGAQVAAFAAWLEPEFGKVGIVGQGEGDLGKRLDRATSPLPTLFVGADAPDMTPQLIRQAAYALSDADAVIGPAADGGYWLLGLARAVQGVFDGIDWGTDRVLIQTMARLAAAEIEPVLLPELADCDRPEDLARWPWLIP